MFFKTFRRNFKFFIPPYYHIDEAKAESIVLKDFTEQDTDKTIYDKYFSKHLLGKKTIADIIEALIGAAYLTNVRMFESFIFMKNIDLYGEADFSKYGKTFFEQLEFKELLYKENEASFSEAIFENASWNECFYFFEKMKFDEENGIEY